MIIFLAKARKLSIFPTSLDIFDLRQHCIRFLYILNSGTLIQVSPPKKCLGVYRSRFVAPAVHLPVRRSVTTSDLSNYRTNFVQTSQTDSIRVHGKDVHIIFWSRFNDFFRVLLPFDEICIYHSRSIIV